MKKDERIYLELEIKARKDLIKRLTYPLNQLTKADAKERAEREKRAVYLSEYETVEDAQNAYGYCEITEEEYYKICEALEAGERYVENTVTPINLALGYLENFIGRIKKEIRAFEFELIPIEELNKNQRKGLQELKPEEATSN